MQSTSVLSKTIVLVLALSVLVLVGARTAPSTQAQAAQVGGGDPTDLILERLGR